MIGDVLVRVSADISDFTRNITGAANQMRHLGDDLQQAGAGIAQTFGSIMAASTLAIGATVKSASDYESAFAGVRKTVDGTEADFQRLSKGIIDMSKRMPESAEDIAAVAESAGQLGIKTDAIMGFTETMVMMGTATNMSSTDAAEALARLANITQMPQDEFDRLGSTVVALGNNLAATETDIVNMGLRIAGAGNTVGMSEDQILSFAGALSSVGIEAEMGGSAISRVMIDIAGAVRNGGDDLENFAKVAGMSSADFKEAFEKDAATGIIAFIEGLGRMQESGEDTFGVLDDLGLSEIRVRDTLLRAAGAGDLFSESLKIGSDAWKENTALTDEAAERYKTFESQLTIFLNKIKDIFRTIGGPFLSALSALMSAAQPLLDLFQRLADWFANSGESMQVFITAMAIAVPVVAAIVTGLGLMMAAIGTVVMAIGTVLVAFMALSAAGIGVGAVVGGLAAIFGGLFVIIPLVVGLVAVIIANWDKIVSATKTAFTAVVDWIKQTFPQGVSAAKGFVSQIGDTFANIGSAIWSGLQTAGTVISDWFSGLPALISDGLQSVIDYIKTGFQDVGSAVGTLTPIIARIGMAFLGISGPVGWVIAVIATLISVFTRLYKTNDTFREGVNNAWSSIQSVIGAVAGFIGQAINVIIDILGQLAETFAPVFAEFSKAFEELQPVFAETGQVLADAFADLGPVFAELGDTFAELGGAFGEIAAVFAESAGEIGATISAELGPMIQAFGELFAEVISSIGEIAAQVIPVVAEFIAGLAVAFTEIVTTVLPVLIEVWSTAFTLMLSVVQAAMPIISALISALVPIITMLVTEVFPALLGVVMAVIPVIAQIIGAVIPVVIAIIQAIVPVILNIVQIILPALLEIFQIVFPIILSIIEAVIPVIVFVLTTLAQFITAVLVPAIQFILEIVQIVFTAVAGVIEGALNIIIGILNFFVALFTGNWTGMWEAIKQILSGAWQIITSVVDGAINLIVAVVTGAWNLIVSVTTAVWNAIVAALQAAWNWITETISTATAKASSVISETWNSILSYLAGVVMDIYNAISNAFDDVVSAVAEKMMAAYEAIQTAWDTAVDFLTGIDLYDIGANIIQGLINGIGSMVGAVTSKIADVAGSIKDGITGLLDIHSPSRWMRDMVGKNISLGIAVGIDKMAKVAIASAKDLASNVADAAQTSMPSIAAPDVSGFERSINGKMRATAEMVSGNMAFEGGAPQVNLTVNNDWDGNQVRTKVNQDNAWERRKLDRYRG